MFISRFLFYSMIISVLTSRLLVASDDSDEESVVVRTARKVGRGNVFKSHAKSSHKPGE